MVFVMVRWKYGGARTDLRCLLGVSVRIFAKEDFMKTRNIIITIMLLFVLFVTGCTPAGVPSGPAADPTNPSTEPTVQLPRI